MHRGDGLGQAAPAARQTKAPPCTAGPVFALVETRRTSQVRAYAGPAEAQVKSVKAPPERGRGKSSEITTGSAVVWVVYFSEGHAVYSREIMLISTA